MKRPRLWRRWWLAPVAVLAAGAVVAAAIGFGGGSTEAHRPVTVPSKTVPVTRADLADYVDVQGVLGYGPAVTVEAKGTGGTITAVAGLGNTVRRGQPLYTVDDQPVTLLYGDLPAYRELSTGVAGGDVRQLEDSLRALGYRGFTVDNEYTGSTAAAVSRWQTALGLPATGKVEPSQIYFAPGPVRIATHETAKGNTATGNVLTYTGTTKMVRVDLAVSEARLATRGARVSVTLPGQDPVPAIVTDVGVVATSPSGNGSGQTDTGTSGAEPTIPLTITFTDERLSLSYDGAEVTVRLTGQIRKNVLCVPVEALLALREGGFGVEVITGDTSRIVPVQVGLFADGRVEIRNGALTESMRVGVPE